MGGRKKQRFIIGILKDKVSLIKATLITKRATSSITVAVLRATTHTPASSPPSDRRLTAILNLGNSSSATASKCIQVIMDRLHHTRNAQVALKCLITLHVVMTRGAFILRDQLSIYPYAGGHNFLNLSKFRDNTNVKTLELSTWVHWYAAVLERNFITSRILGSHFSSSSSKADKEKDLKNVKASLNSDLLRDMDALLCMVQEISDFPNSLHVQQSNLVYHLVKLVGQDYRATQHQIAMRLGEFDERMSGMASCGGLDDSSELMSCLKRLEECKERLVALFVNRHRNDAFWDLVSQTRLKLWKEKEERERGRIVLWKGEEEERSESTRFEGPSPLLELTYGSRWLRADWVHFTVSKAIM